MIWTGQTWIQGSEEEEVETETRWGLVGDGRWRREGEKDRSTHRTKGNEKVVLFAGLGLLDNLWYEGQRMQHVLSDTREGTVGEIDQVELLGRVGVLEPLEPQLSSAVCVSSGQRAKLGCLALGLGWRIANKPVEDDPLRHTDYAVLGLVQRRQLGPDSIVCIRHCSAKESLVCCREKDYKSR